MIRKRLFFTAAIVLGLALLAVGFALYTLQTSWFKQQVRDKIISAAEQASGGRVEIGSFNYHWRSLTAEFSDFVVHGAESPTGPPLLQAASVQVRLRIVSLLHRNVDIALLKVDRPRLYLHVAPNGTTNLPATRLTASVSQFVQQLLTLKVGRFEFENWLVQVDARKFPVTARGDDLNVVLKYQSAAPGYSVSLGSRAVHVYTNRLHEVSGSLKLNAHLERDRLVVDSFSLASGNSTLSAHGALLHFAYPASDFAVAARLDAAELATVASVPGIHGGQIELNGAVHYDDTTGLVYDGGLAGRNLTYSSRELALNQAKITSHVFANRDGAKFTAFALDALGGTLRGSATLMADGNLRFNGNFTGWNTHEVSALARIHPLPWGGVANGRLELSGALGQRNFSVHSVAHINPSRSGVPVSGDIDLSYKQREETLAFGNSHLNLPRTQASFSGTAGKSLQVLLASSDVRDLAPILPFLSAPTAHLELPSVRNNGTIQFTGTISGPLSNPFITGDITAAQFEFKNTFWRRVRARISLAEGGVDFSSVTADSNFLNIAGSGHLGLANWTLSSNSALRLNAQFQRTDLAKLSSSYLFWKLPFAPGIASGTLNLAGSVSDPRGSAHVSIENVDAYGQRVNTIQVDARLEPNALQITKGSVRAGPALLTFSGTYQHANGVWQSGQLAIKADTNGFPLSGLAPVHRFEPGLQGQVEVHVRAALGITPDNIVPMDANGALIVRAITIDDVPYGSVTVRVGTRGKSLDANLSGALRDTRLSGTVQVQLVAGLPSTGELRLDRISLPLLYALATAKSAQRLPLNGSVAGGMTFSGPLEQPDQLRGTVQLDELQLSSAVPVSSETRSHAADLIFRNTRPVVLDAADGIATIRSFEVSGTDTTMSVRGRIPYLQKGAMDLALHGSADLRILQLFDPNLRSAGQSSIATSVSGTLANPIISGTLQLRNGSFFLGNLPMGLTAVNGAVNFNGDRATVQNLTAQSGGGAVSLVGFLTYGHGLPVYHLEANADNVRIRYAGASATATANLRLTGTSDNSVLSGTVTVSRVSFNPNADAGTLLASVAARSLAPVNETDFLTGLQLDVRIQNASDLQVSTSLSRDIEGEIDLRLRGTPDHPILLGSASVNQGDIKVFGTKYSINRGEVSFVNPVKIEPMLNLDLQTQARGISVGITISGTIGKLNINYRSDPPLQPRDIIALLTVGHTPDIAANISGSQQASTDVNALQSGANTVLGAAIAPSSSRLQKLFGVANVRIDPMVQGITNTMQRLTIEQQISRDITVTYVTNLSQTSEQIFRFEWALSPQYSLVALRDDNDEFGIDIQYKKRFK